MCRHRGFFIYAIVDIRKSASIGPFYILSLSDYLEICTATGATYKNVVIGICGCLGHCRDDFRNPYHYSGNMQIDALSLSKRSKII